MSKKIKRFVISLGDPAGIGYEISLKAIFKHKHPNVYFILVGDKETSLKLIKKLKWKHLPVVSKIKDIPLDSNCFYDIGVSCKFPLGQISKNAGHIAFRSLEIAVDLMQSKKFDALVTAPIHKQSILKAGMNFEGHTEYLQFRANVKKVVMLLSGGGLNTALVTRHVPYKDVPKLLTKKEIIEVTKIVYEHILQYNKKPKIGVMGLNPHASDGGRFGDEEKKIITPAIKSLQKFYKGIEGPYPPDTAFHLALKEKWDAEICMYHDQGLIPMKTLAFDSGVNITLGLPFIRTSPDHGTAFDIAGKGIANESSMLSAIHKAIELTSYRKKK